VPGEVDIATGKTNVSTFLLRKKPCKKKPWMPGIKPGMTGKNRPRFS
jgi:hypothetical protein